MVDSNLQREQITPSEKAYALPYDDFYEVYKERYNIVKHQREIAKSEEILSLEKYSIS